MPRPRDETIHRHFEDIDTQNFSNPQVRCRYCQHQSTKLVDRLRKHLERCTKFQELGIALPPPPVRPYNTKGRPSIPSVVTRNHDGGSQSSVLSLPRYDDPLHPPAPAPAVPMVASMQLFRLEHRTILITGGLGGLGMDLCMAMVEHGADVACVDLPMEPPTDHWMMVQRTADYCGSKLWYYPCDVTDQESVQFVFDKIDNESRYPLRGLVTCAGLSMRGPAMSFPALDFRRIMDVNVTGNFLCARAIASIFHRRQVPGSIVMVASMSGTVVNKGVDTAAYNSSKSAILQLGRSLAAEWGHLCTGFPTIRVNTLSPGYIETEATAPTLEALPHLRQIWENGNMLGRLSQPHEYRAPVLFLLADGSSFVTASDLKVDGGNTAW